MSYQITESERRRAAQPADAPPNMPGWDPYEVWRTRILLPRQAAARERASARPLAPAPRSPIRIVTGGYSTVPMEAPASGDADRSPVAPPKASSSG